MDASFNSELLTLAELLLRGVGFETESLHISPPLSEDPAVEPPLSIPMQLLLAQNQYFILAIGAPATIHDISEIEPRAVSEVSRRLAASHLGAKQWDVYVILLTEQTLPDDGTSTADLVSINYNTRVMRRIAHTGVRTDLDAVARALRPFLPLPTAQEGHVLEDALDLLEKELPAHGVSATLAGRAVAAYRETGSLTSV